MKDTQTKVKIVVLYTAFIVALTFALFGRPNRKLRKEILVEENEMST